MGSDISLLTFMQQQNVPFKQHGVAQQADQILYDNGDNMFRLRAFVNPQTTYTNTNFGAIQTTAYDIALAQQIKANDPSAKFELDLHYSDTWASPGQQITPPEWSADTTLALMQTQVYNYTLSTLNQFSAAGVMPDMVEIGNETNTGMLFPTGSISFSGTTASQQATWKNYGSLVISAVNAVHAAQGAGPKIQISMTVGGGNQGTEPQYFYGNLFNSNWGDVPASDIDVMGADYYATKTTDLAALKSNLTALGTQIPNKSIMVMETAQPWENSGVGDPTYAKTPAGQAAYLSALASTLQGIPNVMGLLYWYPEAVQVNPYNIYNGGATALFDASGNALQSVVGTAAAGQSGNGSFSITQHQWNVSGSGTWESNGSWTNSNPNGSDVEADFLGMISGNQTVSTSTAITVGTIRFQSPNSYTLAGTGSLTMQSTVGWGYVVAQQGSHQINVPMTIASSTAFSVARGASLTFAAPVTVNSGQVLRVNSPGTLILSSIVDNGAIDVQSGAMILNYGLGADPIASIVAMITNGYNGGTWTGIGINSTAAQANPAYGVGYADASDPGNPAGLAPGQLEVMYTLLGDANLDGKVNGTDFNILATNFNSGGDSWDQGDFTYDGKVNGSDFNLLAQNFNQGVSGGADLAALDSFAAASGVSLANVPEPASMGILLMGGVGLVARRRRQKVYSSTIDVLASDRFRGSGPRRYLLR